MAFYVYQTMILAIEKLDMGKILKIIFGVTFITLLTNCASLKVNEYHGDSVKWITEPITIIADTQFHENKGSANQLLGKGVDTIIRATLRTSQQYVGIKEVLRHVLLDLPKEYPVLHLGDALDLSCVTEWEQFIEIMQDSGREWCLVPGNHDGYLAGNLHPIGLSEKPNISGWNCVCDKGRYYDLVSDQRKKLSKDRFVIHYLQALRDQYSDLELNEKILELEKHFKLKNEHSFRNSEFLKYISWNIDLGDPWKSYIVQLVKLPTSIEEEKKVHIILFDTSNYDKKPHLAGKNAALSIKQLNAALCILEKFSGENTIFFFGGHHPIKDWKLNSCSKSLLTEILSHYNSVPFYLSAHTHKGSWIKHDIKGIELTELNTGSLNDAPVYYRDLKIGETISNGIIAHSNLTLLDKRFYLPCKEFTLPKKEEPHSIEQQASKSIWDLFYYMFAFWKSKHEEIEPELFINLDFLNHHVPEEVEHKIFYRWEDNYPCLPSSENVCQEIQNRDRVIEEIKMLYKCPKDKCPERRKARFLIAFDEFIEKNARDPERLRLEKMCLAIKASEAEASHGLFFSRINKDKIIERISIKSVLISK